MGGYPNPQLTKSISRCNILLGADFQQIYMRDTYVDPIQWESKAKDLAERFINNFDKYTDNAEGKSLVAAGPQID